MTCSEDGSIRLWDTAEVKQKTVIKPMLRKPGRTTVSTCAYNKDGGSIAAGLVDGSIHIWDAKGDQFTLQAKIWHLSPLSIPTALGMRSAQLDISSQLL